MVQATARHLMAQATGRSRMTQATARRRMAQATARHRLAQATGRHRMAQATGYQYRPPEAGDRVLGCIRPGGGERTNETKRMERIEFAELPK